MDDDCWVDLFVELVGYLDLRDLLRTRLVCKRWYRILRSERTYLKFRPRIYTTQQLVRYKRFFWRTIHVSIDYQFMHRSSLKQKGFICRYGTRVPWIAFFGKQRNYINSEGGYIVHLQISGDKNLYAFAYYTSLDLRRATDEEILAFSIYHLKSWYNIDVYIFEMSTHANKPLGAGRFEESRIASHSNFVLLAVFKAKDIPYNTVQRGTSCCPYRRIQQVYDENPEYFEQSTSHSRKRKFPDMTPLTNRQIYPPFQTTRTFKNLCGCKKCSTPKTIWPYEDLLFEK
jgi:hypothetical protein